MSDIIISSFESVSNLIKNPTSDERNDERESNNIRILYGRTERGSTSD